MKIFKIYYRIIARNKIFSLISIGGFSLSLAVVLLLLAFIRVEKQHDRNIPDLDQIYRVVRSDNSANIPEQAREKLESDYPQVLSATNVTIGRDPVLWNGENHQVQIIHTDNGFFKVFSTSFISGIRDDIFKNPHHAVLTESCAGRIFGEEDPIGKTLNVSHRENVLVVAVVQDLPEKSSLKGDMFCSSDLKIRASRIGYNQQEAYLYILYLKLHPDSKPNELEKDLTKEIHPFMDWLEVEYNLQPFKELYFDVSIPHDHLIHANVKLIRLLGWLALVILFLAVFNYINLTIAQSTGRLHELGVKQVFGADRNHLIGQFISEAFFQVLLALFLSLALSLLLKPVLSGILGKEIQISQILNDPQTLLLVLAGILMIAFISGVYPAIAVLRMQPRLMLLKQVTTIQNSFDIRKLLTVIQFTAMIALIISLITLVKQVRYVHNKDLGYNKELLVRIPVHHRIKNNVPSLLDEISRLAAVKNICASHGTPGAIWSSSSGIDFQAVSHISSDHRFLQTFQLNLLYGRNFHEGEETNVSLINEVLLKEAGGWDSIENRKIFGSEVVGIIGDFHYKDLYNPIGNLQIRNGSDVSHLSIRFQPCDLSKAIQDVRKIFEVNAPGFSFSFEFYDEWLNFRYRQEENRARSIRLLSIIAVLLSCMGLFGIAEFNIRNRTREIGIRKINGAGTIRILMLLNLDFLKWVVFGIVFGIPLGWYFMNRWLADFAFRTSLDWWIFGLAGIASIMVAMLTISWQTCNAARKNPLESLRYE